MVTVPRPSPPAPEGWDKDITDNLNAQHPIPSRTHQYQLLGLFIPSLGVTIGIFPLCLSANDVGVYYPGCVLALAPGPGGLG